MQTRYPPPPPPWPLFNARHDHHGNHKWQNQKGWLWKELAESFPTMGCLVLVPASLPSNQALKIVLGGAVFFATYGIRLALSTDFVFPLVTVFFLVSIFTGPTYMRTHMHISGLDRSIVFEKNIIHGTPSGGYCMLEFLPAEVVRPRNKKASVFVGTLHCCSTRPNKTNSGKKPSVKLCTNTTLFLLQEHIAGSG